MGFSQLAHQRYGQDSGGGNQNNTPFYALRIKAEDGSPSTTIQLDGMNKPAYGFYEVGYFLAPLAASALIWYHPTNKKMELVLCNRTFGGQKEECPACGAVDYYRTLHGDSAEAKKKYPIKAAQQHLAIPFFVPRRQQGRHVYKGQSIIQPIYWFELKVTDYIPDFQEQFDRLRKADEKAQIHCNPYMIFRKDSPQGERQEFFFRSVPFDQSMQIVDSHPLLQFFRPGQHGYLNTMGEQIWDIFENLALLRYQPYIDPQTEIPFDYQGYYQKAVQVYEWVKNQWPKPAQKIEGQNGTNNPRLQQQEQRPSVQPSFPASTPGIGNPQYGYQTMPINQFGPSPQPNFPGHGGHSVQNTAQIPAPPPGYTPQPQHPPVQNYGQSVNYPAQLQNSGQSDVYGMLNDSDIPF